MQCDDGRAIRFALKIRVPRRRNDLGILENHRRARRSDQHALERAEHAWLLGLQEEIVEVVDVLSAFHESHAGGDVVDRDRVLRFLQQRVREKVGEVDDAIAALHGVVHVAVYDENRCLAAQIAPPEIFGPGGERSCFGHMVRMKNFEFRIKN